MKIEPLHQQVQVVSDISKKPFDISKKVQFKKQNTYLAVLHIKTT